MLDKTTTTTTVRGNVAFRRLRNAGPALILLGILSVLALLVAKLFRGVLTSNILDLTGVEPNSIFAIERLTLTGQLYTDPHVPPFAVLQYGPLFPYVAWAVHQLLHLDSSVASFYLAARLAACLSVAAAMIGVGVILTRFLRVGPLLAIIASLLAGFELFPWGYVARPDSLYCALGLWALIAFFRFLLARSLLWLLVSTALLLCAFYAKQTAVAFLPLLGIAGLLCLRTTMQRVVFVLGGAAMAAISAALAPAHFWQNSAVGLANGVDLPWAVKRVYWPLLSQHGIVLAAWLSCLFLVWRGRTRWLFPTALLSVYALAVGTALGVKYGSDINYYDEFLILAVVLVAASLHIAASAWAGPRIAALCFASALLWPYAVTLVQTQVIPVLWRSNAWQIDDRDLLAIKRFMTARPSSGFVADLANNGIGAFLPTRVALQSFDLFGLAVTTGHFDLTPVREAIRSGAICYAVTRRAWATDIGPDYEKRFPWWASPWAAPVLRDLLPRFEQPADFGEYVLLRNPVCPAP
jgi:hypothetical protein